jgi:glycosyltransferase involved in cell wall biosynthesis
MTGHQGTKERTSGLQAPIVNLITELDTGGAQKALARLLARLDQQRFSPSVACLYNGDKTVAQEIRALGIQVTDLGMTAKWRWDAFWRLYRLLHQEQPVILHTWMFHANIPGRLLGRLAGVPVVINSERTMGQESRGRYWLNRMTYRLADRITCVSQQVADFVVRHVGIPRDKTVVIPNGVDVQRFGALPTKQDARTALDLPWHTSLVGTVTRLTPVKRLDVLLQATVSLSDAHLVIVGDGPEHTSLRALVEQLDLVGRVHLVGHQADVLPWLAALDLFVLPSDWEGMSNALLEAMTAGLPVVATAVGGTPEVVVDDVTGLLIPPRDPDALAEAIARLLHNPDLRRTMGEAGRMRVEQQFSIEETVRRTEELYLTLLIEKGY